MDVVDICVPTPLRKTKDPDLSYVVKAVEAMAATLRPGQLVILESTTYPGTTDEVVQPMLEARRAAGGCRLLPRVLARAGRSGQRAIHHEEHPEGRRRRRPCERRGGVGALRVGRVERRAGQLDARRRDGQAAREHVPRGQHRPRERDRADVPPHGHQRLGSDRGGQDQAVRLHAVLSRPGPRRPLHPDRSVLSLVEGAAERVRVPFHRAGRADQFVHAPLRGRASGRRA